MFREYFLVCAGEASAADTSVVIDCAMFEIQQGPAHDLNLGGSVYRRLADIAKDTAPISQVCPGNAYLKCKHYEIPRYESITAYDRNIPSFELFDTIITPKKALGYAGGYAEIFFDMFDTIKITPKKVLGYTGGYAEIFFDMFDTIKITPKALGYTGGYAEFFFDMFDTIKIKPKALGYAGGYAEIFLTCLIPLK